jgi:hypothetical protein
VVIQLGYEPMRIDVLTSASGVDFSECYARRADIEVNGLRVPFIALADLRRNKAATGRLRDLADLADLPQED